jgi:hypothetical protein
VIINDDDFEFDDVYVPPRLNVHTRSTESDYCIAELTENCAYQYWLIFKLVPLMLHALQFVMQCVMWWVFKDFTPQQKQYDILLTVLYPEVHGQKGSLSSMVAVSSLFSDRGMDTGKQITRLGLVRQLATPPFYSVFSFIEMLTVVYVWGELWFPPVYCGSTRPLSLYYYPLLMTMAELVKFNVYVCSVHLEHGRCIEAFLALLNLELFCTNAWVSSALAVRFAMGVVAVVWNTLLSLALKLYHCMTSNYPSWPAVNLAEDDSKSTANPMQSHVVYKSGVAVAANDDGIRLSFRNTVV